MDVGLLVVEAVARAVGVDPMADAVLVVREAPGGPVVLGPLCWVCN